jgi:hypothetical protein
MLPLDDEDGKAVWREHLLRALKMGNMNERKMAKA